MMWAAKTFGFNSVAIYSDRSRRSTPSNNHRFGSGGREPRESMTRFGILWRRGLFGSSLGGSVGLSDISDDALATLGEEAKYQWGSSWEHRQSRSLFILAASSSVAGAVSEMSRRPNGSSWRAPKQIQEHCGSRRDAIGHAFFLIRTCSLIPSLLFSEIPTGF